VVDYLLSGRKSSRTPAEIKRKVLETDLIDVFHWLPKEIDEIPYKRLQELLIMLELKREVDEHKRNVESSKKEASDFANKRGGRKKTYREV
jgi:hypothetical protein